MIPIIASPQKYHWGKKGLSSLVGQYVHNMQEDAKEDYENTHYAELWMGTHPKAPSRVKITEDIRSLLNKDFFDANEGKTVDLNELIEAHKDTFLNDKCTQLETVEGSGPLPFLFKILSIDTSLSIQAHPHKELAEQLNKDFPDIYTDANHKPEMIIALTEFEALCSFAESNVIYDRISSNPSLKKFYADIDIEKLKSEDTTKEVLKEIIKYTFDATEDQVRECVENLLNDVNAMNPDERTREQLLARKLNEQYQNDVGVIVSFLLNHLTLQPGEALVLKPNEPHAYLHGEGLECMATSDNVVRGGLTPKLKDAKVLVDMLTYGTGEIKPLSGEPNSEAKCIEVMYNSGFKEFRVVQIHVKNLNVSPIFISFL